jgi:hypothetical protein
MEWSVHSGHQKVYEFEKIQKLRAYLQKSYTNLTEDKYSSQISTNKENSVAVLIEAMYSTNRQVLYKQKPCI